MTRLILIVDVPAQKYRYALQLHSESKKGSFGARLMLSPWRVYDIVQHLQHHLSIPVTVKCRIGVDGT